MDYLLFVGWSYYPDGGAHDLVGCFETLQDAKDALLTPEGRAGDWWHIADISGGLGTIVDFGSM